MTDTQFHAYCNECGHVAEIPGDFTDKTSHTTQACEECASTDTTIAEYVSALPEDVEPGDYEPGLSR